MSKLDDAARDHADNAAALTGHTDKDWNVLAQTRGTTASWAPTMAAEFIRALRRNPDTAPLIADKKEAREANLAVWFGHLLSGSHGPAFWSDCVLVGLAHAAAGVPAGLVVAAARHIEEVFLAHAMGAFVPSEALRVHTAFARVLATAVSVMTTAGDGAVRDTLRELGIEPARFQDRLRFSIQAQVRNERSKLPRMIWDASLSVGVGALDEQHKQLFELLDEFQKASSEEREAALLGEVVGDLIDYTKIHFAFEETMLLKHGYPELGLHRDSHAKLAAQVELYATAANRGAGPLGAELYFFLRTWLNGHIRGSDRRYGPFLNEQGVT